MMTSEHFRSFFTLILAINLLLSGCASAQTKAPEEVEKHAYFELITCNGALRRGNLSEAENACQRGWNSLTAYQSDIKPELAQGLLRIQYAKRDFKSAEKLLNQIVEMTATTDGKEHVNYASALYSHGLFLNQMGRYAEAELLFNQSKAIMKLNEPKYGHMPEHRVHCYQILKARAMAYVGLGKDAEALSDLKTIHQIQGKPYLDDAELQMSLASLYAQVGDDAYALRNTAKAQPLYEKSLFLYKKYSPQLPEVRANAQRHIGKTIIAPYPSLVSAMTHLTTIYEQAGRTKEACALRAESKEWTTYYKLYPPKQ